MDYTTVGYRGVPGTRISGEARVACECAGFGAILNRGATPESARVRTRLVDGVAERENDERT